MFTYKCIKMRPLNRSKPRPSPLSLCLPPIICWGASEWPMNYWCLAVSVSCSGDIVNWSLATLCVCDHFCLSLLLVSWSRNDCRAYSHCPLSYHCFHLIWISLFPKENLQNILMSGPRKPGAAPQDDGTYLIQLLWKLTWKLFLCLLFFHSPTFSLSKIICHQSGKKIPTSGGNKLKGCTNPFLVKEEGFRKHSWNI